MYEVRNQRLHGQRQVMYDVIELYDDIRHGCVRQQHVVVRVRVEHRQVQVGQYERH